MDSNAAARARGVWDDFASAGFTYISKNGDRRHRTEVRDDRYRHLETRRSTLSSFLNGETDLQSFIDTVSSECARTQLWGFSGHSGMKFFRGLAKEALPENETEFTALLRDALAEPERQDAAEEKLRRFCDYTEEIIADLPERDPSIAVGFVPYFLSYFWQLQAPDTYPTYYASMRDALSDLDVWSPSGNRPRDYIAFWELNEELREVLEAHTGEDIHLWDIERLCLFWNNRDELMSDGGSGDGTDQSGWSPSAEYEYRGVWLRARYAEARNWQDIKSAADATSDAVQALATGLVEERDRIGTTELTAFFRLCQHSDQILVSTKRETVRELGLPETTTHEIVSSISPELGSVGGPNFDLHVPDEAVAKRLHSVVERILKTDSAEKLDDIARDIADLDIDGLQSGKISPILHYLRPDHYPILNSLPVRGLRKYFNEDASTSLDQYVESAETYRDIRDRYGFEPHCRDLDYFFVWAEQVEVQWDHNWTWMLADDGSSKRDVYAIQPGSSSNDDREALWPAWREDGFISVGGENGDLRTLTDEELEEEGEKHGWGATAAWRRFKQMSPGDIVLAKWGSRDLVGIGIVEPSSYSYEVEGLGYRAKDDGGRTRHPHLRSVTWVLTDTDDTDSWSVSGMGLSKQFDRPTAYSYDAFEELRYKLTPLLDDGVSVFATLEEISRTFSGEPATEFDSDLTESTPGVWVEKAKPTEWNYGEPGSGFAYGEAIWTPQKDKNGRAIFETLREPEVGDIVLHLSREEDAIVATSVIDSPLETDFEIPDDVMWSTRQQADGGYRRSLQGFTELEPPFDVRSNLLQVDELKPRLQEIAQQHAVFYTDSLAFRTQSYLTEAPDELVTLLAQQSTTLREHLAEHGCETTGPTPAGTYDTVSEAADDLQARLADEEEETNLLGDTITASLVREWTEMLTGFEPGAEISPADEVLGKQILALYDDAEDALQAQAASIGAGSLPQFTPAETLFIASLRQLQASHGVATNFNQVKYNALRKEAYTVQHESPESEPSTSEPLEPAAEPERGSLIRDLLTDTGQIVFYGPPGTGKTYTAQQFVRWWLNEECDSPTDAQLDTVTFHPSFSYEDFIEGLTAKQTDSGDVAYEIEPGRFKEIAERAREAYQENSDDPDPYILIIDEINRGNLAQIFGEMITALEADKRLEADNEVRISLAHSPTTFTVPPNLYLIGTMNTADRSIALVDAALRRRFRFLGFPPNYQALAEHHGFTWPDGVERAAGAGTGVDLLVALSILAIRELNREILAAPDLGKGKQIGHSFLWNVESEDDVRVTWQFEILPLLEEYYFGQFDRIHADLFDGQGDQLLDFDREQIRDFNASALRAALTTLVDLDTESDEAWSSIKRALDQGLVRPGDTLVFDEGKVEDSWGAVYDSEDPFWQCEVTGERGQQDTVRWLEDDTQYSLSGLVKRIRREYEENPSPASGPRYWRVPSQENELLKTLVERE